MYWIGPGVNYDEGKNGYLCTSIQPISQPTTHITYVPIPGVRGENQKTDNKEKKKKKKKGGGRGRGGADIRIVRIL